MSRDLPFLPGALRAADTLSVWRDGQQHQVSARAAGADLAGQNVPRGHPGFIAGRHYFMARSINGSGVVPTVNLCYLRMIRLPRAVRPAGFGFRSATGQAGSAFKAGLWLNNPTTMKPTGLPFAANNTGEETTANNTIDIAAMAALDLSDLIDYWLGATFTGGTAPTVAAVLSTDLEFSNWMGFANAGTGTAVLQGYTVPHTYTDDIAALNLTEATFTDVVGTAMPLPIMLA